MGKNEKDAQEIPLGQGRESDKIMSTKKDASFI